MPLGKEYLLARLARLVDAVERRRLGQAAQPQAGDGSLLPSLEEGGDGTLSGEQVASLMKRLEGQATALQALEERLVDTQALAARAYEQLQGWTASLDRIRGDPAYADAWEQEAPLVSVRIATYGSPELLCTRALASVLRQSYEHWECIVVGDAEPATTARLVAGLGDPRVRFVNLPFRGPYPEDPMRRWRVAGTAAMNRGAREAKGAWIAPLDHDDEWDEDHIEVLLEHARRSRAELVYGKLRVRDAASDTPLSNVVGAWPPVLGQFGLQGAIYHAGLRHMEMDLNACFAGEPADWNLARRMWEAGVRFAFVDRIVTTYYWTPVDAAGRAWRAEHLEGEES